MKLAVLNVIRSMHPGHGGPVEVIRQFAPVLTKMGHRIETLCADDPASPWLANQDLSIDAVGGNPNTYGRSPAMLRWLREQHSRFDAVVSHGLWQFNNAAVFAALRESGTPYFVFPHGMLDPWFRRAYPIKHIKKQLYWWAMENRVLAGARRVIFTCEEERLLAQNTFFPYRAKEAVAPLGTAGPDLDLAQCREKFLMSHPELKGKRLLLFLGRLHPKKGCDLLLRAARDLNHDLHIVMAGPCDDEDYRKKLESLAAGSAVSFPGMLSAEVKWGAFVAADAFILPSHQENFGMSVVEALACGTPVLISKSVNIWREITADGAGFAETDDLEGTRRLLERWLGLDAAERENMRTAARRCFQSRFEIHRAAKAFIDVLAEGLGKTALLCHKQNT